MPDCREELGGRCGWITSFLGREADRFAGPPSPRSIDQPAARTDVFEGASVNGLTALEIRDLPAGNAGSCHSSAVQADASRPDWGGFSFRFAWPPPRRVPCRPHGRLAQLVRALP